jgi:hypothetical protein
MARATLCHSVTNDGESTVKKGRHRRYEEARALKRGGDLDIESIFDDLSGDRPAEVDDDAELSDDDYEDDRVER